MIVVVGIDSLDHKRLQRFDVPALTLTQSDRLHPPDGIKAQRLQTQSLWPAMIAGTHPRNLFETTDADDKFRTKDWELTAIQTARSLTASYLTPSVKEFLSTALQRAGVEKSSVTNEVFNEIKTIRDVSRNHELISVPGVNEDASNTELKEQFGRMTETDAGTFEFDIGASKVEALAASADMSRMIRMLNAVLSRQHDLVFTHLFSLDPIQHTWASNDAKMERWYHWYNSFVERLSEEAAEDDLIVIVSDHGMTSDGIHSARAHYAASDPIWESTEKRMEDLYGVLKRELQYERHEPDSEVEASTTMDSDTRAHLEDLGYI